MYIPAIRSYGELVYVNPLHICTYTPPFELIVSQAVTVLFPMLELLHSASQKLLASEAPLENMYMRIVMILNG